MTRWTVLLLLAAMACNKKRDDAATARPAPPVAEPAPAAPPWPAGPIVAERVKYAMGLYFQPEPKADPLQAVASCSARLPGLRRVEPGSQPPAEPAFAVRRPPIADFPVPDVDTLRFMAVGLDDAARQAVQKTGDPLILTFAAPGEQAEALVRLAGALLGCVADKTGGLVWDDETRQLFALAAWQEYRVLADRPLRAYDHFNLHAYEQDGSIRMVSLGMAKLGLPDLVVQRSTATHGEGLTAVMNLAAQELFARKKIDAAGQLSVDVATLAAASGGAPGEELPRGPQTLSIVRAEPEKGDAANPLMELSFGGGSDEHVRQAALIRRLFGDEPDKIIGAADDDAELNAASERARGRLPDLARRFGKGLPPGQRLIVKARFADGDEAEWMWIEVRAWKGDQLTGVLLSRPEAVKNVEEGAQVTVSQAGLFDYAIQGSGGAVVEGGETNEVLERRAGKGR